MAHVVLQLRPPARVDHQRDVLPPVESPRPQVVHNVRNHTGWHIQLFHGPTNGPKLRELFADLVRADAITFSDLGSDYMEDWQRLSSMMLLDVFWKAAIGRKVLIFQPDSIMCAGATERIDAFTQYDYVRCWASGSCVA